MSNINTYKLIDVKKIIQEKYPDYLKKAPGFWRKMVYGIIKRIVKEKKINALLKDNLDKKGIRFIEDFFEKLNFTYSISAKDMERIPSEGKFLILANHPLGALDGLALIHIVHKIRRDVKIVANDIVYQIENLKEMILPYDDSFSEEIDEKNLQGIHLALKNENAVVLFPSPEVSRVSLSRIKETKWRKEVITLVQKADVPVLPVYITGKNSILFYLVSFFSKRLSMLMLPRETMKKRNKTIKIKVGNPILPSAFSSLKPKTAIALLRKHTYGLAWDKKGYFKTERTIIHPVDRKELKNEIMKGPLLGKTEDEKMIFFLDFESYPVTMREIGRLREQTFRKMGEGTGEKIDQDEYDKYYRHLVLWDDKELEIVGAYRFGIAKEIVESKGIGALYTATLFDYTKNFDSYIPKSVELGRSFVQQKYWNSYALDYLWHGIGAFLVHNPDTEYLIGPVTISPTYVQNAKEMLVYFYRKWFPDHEKLAVSKNPFIIPEKREKELKEVFTGDSYKEDFKKLKSSLKYYNTSVPTLYKQYTELCETGEVVFPDFGIDESFGNCVDGLIIVPVKRLKEKKRIRYIDSKRKPETDQE